MSTSLVKRLLITITAVVVLTLVSLFMPTQRVDIEGVGTLSFDTSVTLSVGSEFAYAAPDTITNSPSANSGGWTNPTNAYADGTNYASVTSGTPSASHIYNGYGFGLGGATIGQVRIRYDAWSVGNTITNTVTYNAVTKGEIDPGPSGTTLTYSHNVGNQSNKILIVGVAFEGATTSQDVSGVTYNGVAMTKINETRVGTGFIMEVSLWYMLDDQLPDDNANHNVVVTFTPYSENVIESGAISLYNANQAAPTDFGGNGWEASTDPITKQYTTTVDNTMIVDVVGCGNVGSYTASGQTERWDDNVGSSGCTAAGGTRLIATAGTVTNSWDFSSTVNRQAMHVCGVQSYTYQGSFEQIRVDVSWDGGSSWSSKQTTTTTGTETTYWYDVTSATAWTPTKLDDTNFRVRVDAYSVGVASEVRLDWIPVEVTYSTPDISVDPISYDFGPVAEGATPSTGLAYFTVTNNSSSAVDITISGTDMTGGVTWALSDDGNPGTNIYGLKAGLEAGAYTIIVKKNSPYNTLVSNLAASGGTQKWGLQLYAPTTFSDGNAKTGTVTLTATF
jgi:hypothetical protein